MSSESYNPEELFSKPISLNAFNKRSKAVYEGYQLLESQIRYAMENSYTCREAARWLNIHYTTFKKYAKMYFDKETGLSLYDYHKLHGNAKTLAKTRYEKIIKRPEISKYAKTRVKNANHFVAVPLIEIFENKHPKYDASRLKDRLINEFIMPECCGNCGYSLRRDLDLKVPLVLDFKDSVETNMSLENLRLLCYNCNFVLKGKGKGRPKHYEELPDGTLIPKNEKRKHEKRFDSAKRKWERYQQLQQSQEVDDVVDDEENDL
jgi:5-methylcytosine-specific restriction endonuclease McrA